MTWDKEVVPATRDLPKLILQIVWTIAVLLVGAVIVILLVN